MTITPEMAKDLRGSEVYDRDYEKVGKIGEVYVDDQSGQPKWATVNTGLFGSKESFVPLAGARTGRDGLHVAASKKTIKDAPVSAASSGQLSESAERDLNAHYGLDGSGNGQGRGSNGPEQRAEHAGAGRDGGQDAERAGERGMTLSEERLAVGKESVETGRARLRKYVVTEHQSVDVPVSHEEVRLEREPAGEGERGAPIGEDEQSVTLHAERPTVGKETHAVENVRLAKDTVTEHRSVGDEVRKEHLDVSDPDGVVASEKGKARNSQDRTTKK